MDVIDLKHAAYDDFVIFLFDRPVVAVLDNSGTESGPWYWHVESQFQPLVIADFYIRLFTESKALAAQFSDEQLEQGFWAIPSCNLDCGVLELIWISKLPFDVRASVVRSMFHLFEGLFSLKPLDTSVNMWWDMLTGDWACGNRSRENGGEDLLMQDVMFETLSKILHIQCRHVQIAALHGLGHLHHPDTQALIDVWLAEHGDIDAPLMEYARAAAKFQVM